MLSTSVEIVADTPAMVLLAGGATVFQVVWILVWSYAFAGAGATADPLSILFLVVANFWTVQVIKNVVHVTVCGTVAAWSAPPTLSVWQWWKLHTLSYVNACAFQEC